MRTFNVDMIPGGSQTAVACNQYEKGDIWVFALYYDGGRYDIPAGATVSITGQKSDGTAFNVPASVSDNTVLVTVTEQMTAAYGKCIAEVLVQSGNTTLYTANFYILVEPAAVQVPLADTTLPLSITAQDGTVYVQSDLEEATEQMITLAAQQQYQQDLASGVAQRVVEQYAGSTLAGSKQTVKSAIDALNSTLTTTYGSPLVASSASDMTDKTRVYVYTGSESGYTSGNWYYWNGSAWTSGGAYNSTAINTDKTLAVSGMAADANVTGTKMGSLEKAHNALSNSQITFLTDMEDGSIDSSNGEDVDSTSMIRCGFIDLSTSRVTGYYAERAASFNLVEYDENKSFVKRTLINTVGFVTFTYQPSTAYIRYTYLKARSVDVFLDVPFAEKADVAQISESVGSVSNIIPLLSEECVHHDNFSRTMTGYEIGKNSDGDLSDNSYDTVTGATSDDGVRVDDGLTIAADSSRSVPFTVRKIATSHGSSFMLEFSTPSSSQGIYIIYNLTDAKNFEALNITYSGTYYSFIQRTVANGSFKTTIANKNIYNTKGYLVKLYFIGGTCVCYIDNKYVWKFTPTSVDDHICFGAYKGVTAHLDFINIFNLGTPLVYDTEYLTDDGVSTLPNSTLSANTGRYDLSTTTTRFSDRSEHFMLYADDAKINNGRRTERSLVALLPQNLRSMKYEFDVLFPSSVEPDTATSSYADIFFQLHDRQSGVSRGHVPFDLALIGNQIKLTQYYSGEQASETLTQAFSDVVADVTYDKWMHFDFYIHERYAENQHPFMELKINGETVYQSRKPNCTNDVSGSSAQYGEYKNNFDKISFTERYFDNFKVTY